jgi:hypothetical protein
MSEYRVDRVDELRVPCGMNSIVYVGRSYSKALRIFNQTDTGIDPWGRPDASYGLALSQYDPHKRDYVITKTKGVENVS